MILCLLAVLPSGRAFAQDDALRPNDGAKPVVDPLVDRQAIVQERLDRFENRLFELAQSLRDEDPEKAERAAAVLSLSRGKSIRQRMQVIAEDIQAGRYADVIERQDALMADIGLLLGALQEPVAPERDSEVSIEDMQKLLDELREIRRRQEQLLTEAEIENDGQASEAAATQRNLKERTQSLAEECRTTTEEIAPHAQTEVCPLLDGAADEQSTAADHLEKGRPIEAETPQRKAVDLLREAEQRLEESIEHLKKMQQQADASDQEAGECQGESSSDQQKKEGEKEGKCQKCGEPCKGDKCDKCGGKPGDKPAEESRIPQNGSAGVSLRDERASPGEMWGRMPPKERERILQSMQEQFPNRYRELLEQYYEHLAKETPVE